MLDGCSNRGRRYFLPPRTGAFTVLPATRACLQGFCEFLRCYRGATEAGTKRGWSRSAVDKHRGTFLLFVALGFGKVRIGSERFGKPRIRFYRRKRSKLRGRRPKCSP